MYCQTFFLMVNLIQKTMVNKIAAKNTIPPPHSMVSSTPRKSMQWKAAPARKKKKPRDLKLGGIVDVDDGVDDCIIDQPKTRLVKLIHAPKSNKNAGTIAI